MSLTLAGSLTGFLFYNFSRRNKIFMGDTGSLITGFMIGILAIKFIDLDHVVFGDMFVTNEPTVAILILAIPLFDALRMFSIRIYSGQSPFRADRSHMHHLLLDHGFTHLKISGILYAANILFIVLAFTWIQQVDKYVSVGVILLLFLMYCLAAFLLIKYGPYGFSGETGMEEENSEEESVKRKVTKA
jgi:UDP-N-acetylmuramyl pentapeptide phosphotransferase/UDP-N-acetylglucosamine-1-phosphate transferase